MSDTENVIMENEDDLIVECNEPVQNPKPKVKKVKKDDTDDEEESLGSSSDMSEDEESIGSLAEFLAPEDADVMKEKSPPIQDIKDETMSLIEEAKSFLGDSTLDVKVKNGRTLRGNPKSTEGQRKYWTRRVVYLQCLDDINSKIWKIRGRELGLFNLKDKMPDKVDVDGGITDEKWELFINYYNDLKFKLFEEDSEEDDDDEEDDSDEDEEDEEEEEDDDEEDEDEEDEDDDDDDDDEDDDEDDEDEEEDDDDDDDDDAKENKDFDKKELKNLKSDTALVKPILKKMKPSDDNSVFSE